MMLLRLSVAAALGLPCIHAWGGLGHRTVAYLAEKGLTDEAACMVNSILDNPYGWDISDAATWADKSVRRRRPETKQWHYIDAQDDPPRTCGVQYKRDCNQNGTPGCVVSAITNMTEILKENTSGETDQREALMFLIHFIGDVHQPLHTENMSRGGNGIHACFDNSCGRVNLHSIWDTLIPVKSRGLGRRTNPYKERKAAAQWAHELYGAYMNGTAAAIPFCDDVTDPQKCALLWADESNALVCDYVLAKGVEWIEEHDLGGEYFEGAAPIVDASVTKAGFRLAAWLNSLAVYRKEACGSKLVSQANGEQPVEDTPVEGLLASLEL